MGNIILKKSLFIANLYFLFLMQCGASNLKPIMTQLAAIEYDLSQLLVGDAGRKHHVTTPSPVTIVSLDEVVRESNPEGYQTILLAVAKKFCSHATTLTGLIDDFLTDYHLPKTSLYTSMLLVIFLREVASESSDATHAIIKQYNKMAKLFSSLLFVKQEELKEKKSSHKKWLLLALLFIGCWASYKIYKQVTKKEPSSVATAVPVTASVVVPVVASVVVPAVVPDFVAIKNLEVSLAKLADDHAKTTNDLEDLHTKIELMGANQVNSIEALVDLMGQQALVPPGGMGKRDRKKHQVVLVKMPASSKKPLNLKNRECLDDSLARLLGFPQMGRSHGWSKNAVKLRP